MWHILYRVPGFFGHPVQRQSFKRCLLSFIIYLPHVFQKMFMTMWVVFFTSLPFPSPSHTQTHLLKRYQWCKNVIYHENTRGFKWRSCRHNGLSLISQNYTRWRFFFVYIGECPIYVRILFKSKNKIAENLFLQGEIREKYALQNISNEYNLYAPLGF